MNQLNGDAPMNPVGVVAKQPQPVSLSLTLCLEGGEKKSIRLFCFETYWRQLAILIVFLTGLCLKREALIDQAKFWKHLRGSLG